MENCAKRNIPAVLLSSAQIWGGGWWESVWNRHSENSKLTPSANTYGMQKVAAEALTMFSNIDDWNRMKIIRTSYVFNRERLSSRLRNLQHDVPVDAPRFIKRSFIHIDHFVTLVQNYCNRFSSMPPILHLAGTKTVSYYDFWLEIAKQYGYDKNLVIGRRVERNVLYAAKRPHNAGLDVGLSAKLGFPQFDYIGGIERMKEES